MPRAPAVASKVVYHHQQNRGPSHKDALASKVLYIEVIQVSKSGNRRACLGWWCYLVHFIIVASTALSAGNRLFGLAGFYRAEAISYLAIACQIYVPVSRVSKPAMVAFYCLRWRAALRRARQSSTNLKNWW